MDNTIVILHALAYHMSLPTSKKIVGQIHQLAVKQSCQFAITPDNEHI